MKTTAQSSPQSVFRQKLKESNGFGTLEVVIILAVLLAVALLFRETLLNFARSLIDAVFKPSIIGEFK